MKRINDAFRLLRRDLKNNGIAFILIIIILLALKLTTGNLCPFVLITGYPCPGCGMTRAVLHLLQGEFIQAAVMNPFVYGIIVLGGCHLYYRYFRRESWKYARIAWGILLGLMIVYYMYRMLVWFPDRPPMQYYYHSVFYRLRQYFV